MSIGYHLRELEIAKDPSDPRNVLPALRASDHVVLDIGCGIGQTLVALDCPDRQCVGIDVDRQAIEFGRANFPYIDFHLADACHVPLEDHSVDLLIARVTLPYTNIPAVVREMHRLLKRNGRVWMTLHSWDLAKSYFLDACRRGDVKDIVHKAYVLSNGILFKRTGHLLPFLNAKYESWQELNSMCEYLERCGFLAVRGEQNGISYLEATVQVLSENVERQAAATN